MTDSDLIGETSIKLSTFCVGSGIDEWYDIQYKGKQAGTIHLKSEWTPTGAALVEAPKDIPPP